MDGGRDRTDHALYLIAGRLLWDSNFVNSLHENPRDAITETLSMGGIDPYEDEGKLLTTLLDLYNQNKDNVLKLAHEWYSSVEVKPMVA